MKPKENIREMSQYTQINELFTGEYKQTLIKVLLKITEYLEKILTETSARTTVLASIQNGNSFCYLPVLLPPHFHTFLYKKNLQ